MPATIRELSRRCNLSISAVSKALNGYPDINEETRALVRRTAAEMGYFPNALARGLKTKHTNNLGILFSDGSDTGLLHNHFIHVLDSFRRKAEKLGYDILFINHQVGARRMSYLDHCRYRNVDGVCVACIDFTEPEVLELVDSSMPLLTIEHPFPGRAAVLSCDREGMRSLTGFVLDKGHRDVAFLHGRDSYVADERLAGYYEAFTARGLAPGRAIPGIFHDPVRCRAATEALLREGPMPTCLLLPDDTSALGAMEALSAAGLRVPEDISVAGYDGVPLIQRITPRLTTYAQDTARIGREAAARLVAQIENPGDAAPEVLRVPGRLLVGDTVAGPAR